MVLGLTLIIAGGLGNFIDRISQGFVVVAVGDFSPPAMQIYKSF